MLSIYGSKFAAQWEKVEPAAMRATWGDALGHYDGERIKWALDHLIANNPYPPTLPEFVALCRQAPRPQPVALPAPEVSAEVQAQRLADLERAARKIAEPNQDHIAWARTPPAAKDRRGAWATLLMDCVAMGYDGLRPILAEHVRSGVIKSDRATGLLHARDEA
jgi:hypothetical protein